MAAIKHILPGELWKAIPGFEGRYEVSNLGRIWSVERSGVRSGVILKPWRTPKGYLKVHLHAHGERDGATRYIHSLVLTAFVGPREEKMEAAHLNGIPDDNRLENLRWVTSKENKLHQRIHGTQPIGEVHHSAILTPDKIAEIKQLRAEGFLWREIAARFGVSNNTVRHAGLGLTYAGAPLTRQRGTRMLRRLVGRHSLGCPRP